VPSEFTLDLLLILRLCLGQRAARDQCTDGTLHRAVAKLEPLDPTALALALARSAVARPLVDDVARWVDAARDVLQKLRAAAPMHRSAAMQRRASAPSSSASIAAVCPAPHQRQSVRMTTVSAPGGSR